MRIAVVGSRTFKNYPFLKSILNEYRTILCDIDIIIISGGAIGADKLAEQWADENNIPKKIFLPNWNKYGKSAGFIRNQLIVDNCDFVLAFWDGKSKGTKNTIEQATKSGKRIRIFWKE